MFKIYQRFENGGLGGGVNKDGTRPMHQGPTPGNRPKPPADFKKEEHQESLTNQQSRQREVGRGGFNQRRTLPQNIRVANSNCSGGQFPQSGKKTGRDAEKGVRKRQDFLGSILPKGLYNSKTKKLFGVLCAEDLMLVALIFLLLESDSEDNIMTVLVLLYVLLSDYIDLPELGF